MNYALLVCCVTAMLPMRSAAALAKMEWGLYRDVRPNDTPIDMAIAADGTAAKMQTDKLTNPGWRFPQTGIYF